MPAGALAFHNAAFGAGTGPIHFDNTDCSGSEDSLINCSRSSFIRCNSGHSEDAGVRCQGIYFYVPIWSEHHLLQCGSYIFNSSLQLLPVATVLMVMFVWWEAPISMRVEWRCASMTNGGQCVMTSGAALMLL